MYNLSIFIGRFQPFHVGHLYNVRKALKFSNKLIINIGSSFNTPNTKNPFSFKQRKDMILSDLKLVDVDIFRVKIESLVDCYYSEEKWKANLRKNVAKYVNFGDSVVLVGHKKDFSSYYLNSFPEWDYISVDSYKDYSATNFRDQYYKGYILTEYTVSKSSDKGAYKFLKSFMNFSLYEILKESYIVHGK